MQGAVANSIQFPQMNNGLVINQGGYYGGQQPAASSNPFASQPSPQNIFAQSPQQYQTSVQEYQPPQQSSLGSPVYQATAPGQYSQNGFGQYTPNISPNQYFNNNDQQAINQLVLAANQKNYAAQAAALPADSPYKNYLDQEAQYGYNPMRGDGQTYNGWGGPENIIPTTDAYGTLLQYAQQAGVPLSPQLAADAMAIQNSALQATNGGTVVYGPSGGASGGTGFGAGDASGYSDPTMSGYTPGITNAITPTQQSMAPGGLFGDSAGSSAFPGYQYQGPAQGTIWGGSSPLPAPSTPDGVSVSAPAGPASTAPNSWLPDFVDTIYPSGYTGNIPGVTPSPNPANQTPGTPGYDWNIQNQLPNGSIITMGPYGIENVPSAIAPPVQLGTSLGNDIFDQQSAPTNNAQGIINAQEAMNNGFIGPLPNAIAPQWNMADGINQGVLDGIAKIFPGASR